MKQRLKLFSHFTNDNCKLVAHPVLLCAFYWTLILGFAVVFLSSCEFWHKPVREYFESWTMEVAIEKYELVGIETYPDKDGNLCISSSQDVPVILFLRNPKHFDIDKDSDIVRPGSFPEIQQDADDKTLLHFTYSQAYLKNFDGKEDNEIGSSITMLHPNNRTEKKFTFNLKCNSMPPLIEDAAIMTTGTSPNQIYVLAFRCPPISDCGTNGIHHDIVSMTINGQVYSAVPNDSGELIFNDSRFTTTRPESLFVLNRKFDPSTPNAMYFISGETVPVDSTEAKSKTYTIGYTDRAGLETSVTVEAIEAKMSVPIVTNNSGTQLVEGTENLLAVDPEKAYSTITISLPELDETDQSVADCHPQILWTLKKTDGTEVVQTDPAITSPSPTDVELKIPGEGQYTLVAWASADGHRDSVRKTYQLNLVYQVLLPPAVKNGIVTLSTGESNNNYLLVDPTTFKASVNVEIPNQTEEGSSVSGVSVSYSYLKDGEAEPNTGTILGSYPTLSDFTPGYWALTVTASKPGFISSAATYRLRTFSSNIYVKSSTADSTPGDDSNGDGLPSTPFATIARAAEEIQSYSQTTVEYAIHVMDTITLTETQGLDGTVLNGKAAKITLTGDSTGILDGNSNVTVLSISTSVPVTITNLTIQNGKTSGGGGGINAASGTNITLETGCMLSGNESTSSSTGGGAVFTYGTITVNAGCNMTGNKATYGYGGAVYMGSGSKVTINGGTIGTSSSSEADTKKNTAELGGGAIYAGSSSELTINGGTIGYNYSHDMGGAIYNVGTCTLSGASVIGNNIEKASSLGGGIYNTSTLIIEDDTTIKENYVQGAGSKGGGIYNTGNITMSGGTIKSNNVDNAASGQGGGVYNANSFTMSGGTIESNTATVAGGKGGGIYNAGTFTMSGGTIKGNKADGAAGQGGGIYNTTDTCSIKGTFQDNSAKSKGGAIFTEEIFTLLAGSDLNGASSSEKNNDIYLADGKYIDNKSGTYVNNTAAITMETWKRKELVLKFNSKYDKFSLTKSQFAIAPTGKLKLNGKVKIKYNLNFQNTTYVSPGKFQLKEEREGNPNNYTSQFNNSSTYTHEVYDDGSIVVVSESSSTKAKLLIPTTGCMDVIDETDTAFEFDRWKVKTGASTYQDHSRSEYYDAWVLDYVNSNNEVTLYAVWNKVTGSDAHDVWKSMVYDYDYYGKHNTFHVWDATQFKQIFDGSDSNSLCRKQCNFDNKTIIIENNIDAGNIKTCAAADKDGYDAGISFKGVLTGNNKDITANVTGSAKGGMNTGLLDSLNGGTIINVKFTSGHVYASAYGRTGGIVGAITPQGGTITGCTVSVSVVDDAAYNVNSLVGGIAGIVNAGTITDCTVNTTVKGKSYVGGIVGNASGGTITGNTFMGSAVHAVNDLNTHVGALGQIVGMKEDSATVTGNTASGSTDPAVSTGTLIVNALR